MMVVIVLMISIVNRIFCMRTPISGENRMLFREIHDHAGCIRLKIDIKSEFLSNAKNKKYHIFNATRLVFERLSYLI
jgi:hypothetical protein